MSSVLFDGRGNVIPMGNYAFHREWNALEPVPDWVSLPMAFPVHSEMDQGRPRVESTTLSTSATNAATEYFDISEMTGMSFTLKGVYGDLGAIFMRIRPENPGASPLMNTVDMILPINEPLYIRGANNSETVESGQIPWRGGLRPKGTDFTLAWSPHRKTIYGVIDKTVAITVNTENFLNIDPAVPMRFMAQFYSRNNADMGNVSQRTGGFSGIETSFWYK